MSYESDRHAKEQDATEAMIRMRQPVVKNTLHWEERARKAEDFIQREGYSRCDIAACNCNSWHGGSWKRRFDEIHDALTEADISTNGKTVIGALREHLGLEPL